MKLKGEISFLGLVLIDKESLETLKDKLSEKNWYWEGFYFRKRVDEDLVKARRLCKLEGVIRTQHAKIMELRKQRVKKRGRI